MLVKSQKVFHDLCNITHICYTHTQDTLPVTSGVLKVQFTTKVSHNRVKFICKKGKNTLVLALQTVSAEKGNMSTHDVHVY